jgi:tRNA-dihydrouridine synthase B
MMDETGCDMVMIARGMLGNPWIFREAVALWKDGEKLPAPTMEERKKVMEDHLARVIREKGEHRGVQEMRKHIGWYIKGMNGAAAFRAKINLTEKPEDTLALIRSFFEDQDGNDWEGENGDENKN